MATTRSERAYYDLNVDPDEVNNIHATLPALQRQRLHEALVKYTACGTLNQSTPCQ
ncbi:hypothetical protein [Vineibacter terrae]|uniref:hypothetical protein n=1 Tax=Vineibacter terrae TaxID=2586908 RepID=UPI0015B541FB|nr:hypothetical protein [Vineibacter terrae]